MCKASTDRLTSIAEKYCVLCPHIVCVSHEHARKRMATYHFSLLTSRDIRHVWGQMVWLAPQLSCLLVYFYPTVTVCAKQLLWTGWILITRCCYFKASVSRGITAKPAENLSAVGNKCPPEACPAPAPGRKSLAPWLAFPHSPPVGHLCRHARHRVCDPALLLLCSLQPELTPSGIYKDLFSKGVLEIRHSVAATYSCAHKDGDGVFGRWWSGRYPNIQASGAV